MRTDTRIRNNEALAIWPISVGVAIIVIALSAGIWVATQEGLFRPTFFIVNGVNFRLAGEGFWGFLAYAMLPLGVAMALAARGVAYSSQQYLAGAVTYCKVAAADVVMSGVVSGIKIATDDESDAFVLAFWMAIEFDESQFWVFLSFIPVSIGFGLLALTPNLSLLQFRANKLAA